MADSVVNVSGYDASYGIDAFLVHETPTTTDYRQIVAIGGDSSAAGATVTVANNALTTSSHDVTVHTKLTEIDTVLDTIKVDTEAIETAVEGTLKVEVNPATTAYLSHVYLDLDAAGDNPTSNQEVIATPGSGNKLVIYGIQGSAAATTTSDYGNWYLSDGNTSNATTLWAGRIQGVEPTHFSITFPYGVALTADTALEVTSTEGSGQIRVNAVIYYRTEAT